MRVRSGDGSDERSVVAVYFAIVYNIIPEIIVAVKAAETGAPKKTADSIAAAARDLCPVDTGALRASIQSSSVERGKEAEVSVSAEYAAYVEFGTYKMAAQPFLVPAFEEHKMELVAEMIRPIT